MRSTTFQKPVRAGPRRRSASWPLEQPGRVALLDVVRNAKPTDADRRLRPAGRVLRADRPGDGREQSPAGHLPAVQSDLARRGDAGRHRALERRPRRDRHRQPVPAAACGTADRSRSTRPTTPTSSRASASASSRCRRAASPTPCSWRRRRRWRRCRRRGTTRRQSAAAGHRVARGLDRGGARRRPSQARREGLTRLHAKSEIEAAIHAKMWSPKYLPYRRTKGRAHDD